MAVSLRRRGGSDGSGDVFGVGTRLDEAAYATRGVSREDGRVDSVGASAAAGSRRSIRRLDAAVYPLAPSLPTCTPLPGDEPWFRRRRCFASGRGPDPHHLLSNPSPSRARSVHGDEPKLLTVPRPRQGGRHAGLDHPAHLLVDVGCRRPRDRPAGRRATEALTPRRAPAVNGTSSRCRCVRAGGVRGVFVGVRGREVARRSAPGGAQRSSSGTADSDRDRRGGRSGAEGAQSVGIAGAVPLIVGTAVSRGCRNHVSAVTEREDCATMEPRLRVPLPAAADLIGEERRAGRVPPPTGPV